MYYDTRPQLLCETCQQVRFVPWVAAMIFITEHGITESINILGDEISQPKHQHKEEAFFYINQPNLQEQGEGSREQRRISED